MREIDRRAFLATGGLALAGLAVACGKKGSKLPSGGEFTMNDVITAVERNGRFQMIQAVGDVLAGPEARVSFALVTADNQSRLTGGTVQVYAAFGDADNRAIGPVPASYHDQGLGDKGVYVVRLPLDKTGTWLLMAVGKPKEASADLYGGASYNVVMQVPGPAPGAKAIPVATPTVDNHRGVEPYCTRTPPCAMHALSLDVALANGKPTVFNIGTPQFCTSRVCGPVVDVIETVSQQATGVNFVHAEVYPDDKDAPAKQQLTATAAAYSLEEEPITYWIRPDGTITERIVGPTDVSEVRALTQKLLSG